MSGFNNFPQQQYGNYPNMNMNPMFGNNNYQSQLEKYLIDQATQRNQQNQINSNMDFIPVVSEEEAEKYIVQKGQTIWFRHSSEPEIYVKSVSTIGEPNFGAYTLTKKEKKVEEEKNYREIEPKFATEDDINTLQSSIKEQMSNITKHIEAIEQKIGNIPNIKKEEGGKKQYNNSTQSQKVGV